MEDELKEVEKEDEIQEIDFTKVMKPSLPYKPKKIKFGRDHPTPLEEGSALSCVDPPDITAKLEISSDEYEGVNPHLSNVQLEAVLYALQAHSKTIIVGGTKCAQAFLLGDGTGLGKSRILAALLKEYALRFQPLGVWITASEKLIPGIALELSHFKLNIIRIPGETRNKKAKDGVSNEDVKQNDEESNWEIPDAEGVIILTYNGLCDDTRLERLHALLGKKFEGVIIFDESHLAKHAATKHSQAGVAVTNLQKKYPRAKVVYSSATGASEPTHLGYMVRLGLWGKGTCFYDFKHFCAAAGQHKVPFLELMALDLKRNGVFLARQISLREVKIYVESAGPLKRNSNEVWRRSCDIFYILLAFIKQQRDDKVRAQRLRSFYGLALEYFRTLILSSKIKKTESICRQRLQDSKESYSLVIALQRTGESGFQRFWEHEYNRGNPYSAAGDILRLAILNAGIHVGCPKLYTKRHPGEFFKIGDWDDSDDDTADDDLLQLNVEEEYEVPNEDELVEGCEWFDVSRLIKTGCRRNPESGTSKSAKYEGYVFEAYSPYMVGSYSGYGLRNCGEDVVQPKELTWSVEEAAFKCDEASISRLYHELLPFLPINPMDELYMRLCTIENGNFKDKISNCTGRREFYTTDDTDEFVSKYGGEVGCSIPEEIENFMSGSGRIAIISDACSMGISLHAEKNSKNTDKRVHITIQWPWAADKLIQQLGRTNRCNQLHPPEFILVSSEIPAEIRFISVVSQRLRQLGAICHGQSQSCPLLQKIDSPICSTIGIKAIQRTIQIMKEDDTSFANIWSVIKCPRFKLTRRTSQDSITAQVSTFFNRVLLMEPDLQKKVLDQILIKMTDLQEAGERVYSPIVELSHESKDYTMTYKSSKAIQAGVGTFEVYCFAINRTLKLEDIPTARKEAGTYYIRNDAPCLVYQIKNEFFAHYPFCRSPIPITKENLSQSKKISTTVATRKWNCFVIAAEKKENIGQCFHKVATGSCKKDDCNKNLSVFKICLVTGPAYLVFTSLSNFVNQETAQIAVVHFKDKCMVEKSVAGLLLNFADKKDIERNLCRFTETKPSEVH